MALIRIYKGKKSLQIPSGAYKYQYAPYGWTLDRENEIKNTEVETSQPDEEKEESGYENEASEVEEEQESFDIEDLEEKPLSELTVPELRELAEHKGVDVTGLTSAKKLREAIKEVQ